MLFCFTVGTTPTKYNRMVIQACTFSRIPVVCPIFYVLYDLYLPHLQSPYTSIFGSVLSTCHASCAQEKESTSHHHVFEKIKKEEERNGKIITETVLELYLKIL